MFPIRGTLRVRRLAPRRLVVRLVNVRAKRLGRASPRTGVTSAVPIMWSGFGVGVRSIPITADANPPKGLPNRYKTP